MEIAKKDLEELAEVARLLMDVKDTEEIQELLGAIPALCAELKPMIAGLNKFATDLDIAAVKQLEKAGFTTEQAIALRCGSKLNPVSAFAGAFQGAKNSLRNK